MGRPSLHPCPVSPAARAPGLQEHEVCVAAAPPVLRGVRRAAGRLRGGRGDGRPVLRAGVLPRSGSALLACVAPMAPFCRVSRSPSCSRTGHRPRELGWFGSPCGCAVVQQEPPPHEQGGGPWGVCSWVPALRCSLPSAWRSPAYSDASGCLCGLRSFLCLLVSFPVTVSVSRDSPCAWWAACRSLLELCLRGFLECWRL